MDFSKLPKLSDSQMQSPPPPTSNDVLPVPVQMLNLRQPGIGVDIWISVAIGILLLMLGGSFGRYAVAKISGKPFHTNITWQDDSPKAGQEVDYFELEGYSALSDMGIFLFGAMLLFEAAAKSILILKPGSLARAFLGLALILTVATLGLNSFAAFKMYNVGIIPGLSLLAIAFGGWILYDEWHTLRASILLAKPNAAGTSSIST